MRFTASCLFVFTLLQSTEIMAQQHLRDYQWKQRIILLFTPNPYAAAIKSQAELVQMHKTEFEERDVLIFMVSPHAVSSLDHTTTGLNAAEVYDYSRTVDTFSGVVFIGKDGGVKLKGDYEVAPQRIIDLIDSMPMRRAEIRQNP